MGLNDVELATLEYVGRFNRRRLHGHCGDIAHKSSSSIAFYPSIGALGSEVPAEPSLH